MILSFATVVAAALYLLASWRLAAPMLDGRGATRPLPLLLAAAAVAIHIGVLMGAHRGALDLHFFAALSLVAMLVAALTLIVNLYRPVAGLGVIVFPLAALLLLVDVFLAPPTTPQPLDWQIKLHVSFALIGFGVLSIAALLAILLAVQEHALRTHRLYPIVRALPPLTLTETLLFQLITTGFALLTLTLLTGILFVDSLFAQHLVQKTALSILAWIVFGILLLGRWRRGWRGPRAVNLTLLGMVVLLLGFFGSKFLLELGSM